MGVFSTGCPLRFSPAGQETHFYPGGGSDAGSRSGRQYRIFNMVNAVLRARFRFSARIGW
jgi:hypothetical protein